MTQCTMVTPDEARAIAQRFIDAYFDNGAERPRVSIPADPRRDDDLRLLAFIERAERVFDADTFVRGDREDEQQARMLAEVERDEALAERDALRTALDEARRERDEAVRATQRETHRLLVEAWDRVRQDDFGFELRHAVEALDDACATIAGGSKDAVYERLMRERDEARQALCSLLSAHRSPSDAVRIAGHREAEEKRRGWGM